MDNIINDKLNNYTIYPAKKPVTIFNISDKLDLKDKINQLCDLYENLYTSEQLVEGGSKIYDLYSELYK